MVSRFMTFAVLFAAALTFGIIGCSGPTNPADAGHEHDGHDHAAHDHADHDHGDHAAAGHAHGEWWCAEHGVPEEECSQCSAKVAAALKKKGDWCQEHDRADSQCFICHPEYEAKFAARYEAKYGKPPPKMQ